MKSRAIYYSRKTNKIVLSKLNSSESYKYETALKSQNSNGVRLEIIACIDYSDNELYFKNSNNFNPNRDKQATIKFV